MAHLYVNVVSGDDHFVEGVFLSEKEAESGHKYCYRESVPVGFEPKNGQIVYVVHAQWSTGDSMSEQPGYCHEVVMIYDNPENAIRDRNALRNHKEDDDPVMLDGKVPYHPGWHGYFESLDWVKCSSRAIGMDEG